jgi:hypothetical protein
MMQDEAELTMNMDDKREEDTQELLKVDVSR